MIPSLLGQGPSGSQADPVWISLFVMTESKQNLITGNCECNHSFGSYWSLPCEIVLNKEQCFNLLKRTARRFTYGSQRNAHFSGSREPTSQVVLIAVINILWLDNLKWPKTMKHFDIILEIFCCAFCPLLLEVVILSPSPSHYTAFCLFHELSSYLRPSICRQIIAERLLLIFWPQDRKGNNFNNQDRQGINYHNHVCKFLNDYGLDEDFIYSH